MVVLIISLAARMLPLRYDCEILKVTKFCANLVGKVTIGEAIQVATVDVKIAPKLGSTWFTVPSDG